MTMPNGPKWCCTLYSLGYSHHRNCERGITMDDFPKPFSYESLRVLRDDLIRDAEERGDDEGTVAIYLSEFVHQVEEAMAQSYTVFYQP